MTVTARRRTLLNALPGHPRPHPRRWLLVPGRPSGAPRRARAFVRGFTLIELILVLGVGSMIALLSFQGMKRDTERAQARVVGQQLRTVGQAVNTYLATRYTPISQLSNAAGTASDPGPRTCSGTTCTITVQTLVNEGLLPATYQNLNGFHAGYTITVTVSGTAPNWDVSALVSTSTPWTTGGVVRYDLLGQAMAEAGADSGMTRASATRVDGYNGVWSLALPGGQLGMLGFRAGDGTGLYSVYLRRDGTLPMTGDLNMSDGTAHSIDNVANVTGTGRFTSAQTYTSYVNLAGNLDMTGTATIQGNANVSGNLGVSGTALVGQTLSVNGATSLAQTLTVAGNTTLNQGLTVGQNAQVNGNATVNGGITTGTLLARTSIQSNGTISASGNVSSGANVAATGNVSAGGNVTATGTVLGGYLQPTNVVAVGGGCTAGQIATTGSTPVQCKGGTWQPILGKVSIVQSPTTCGPGTSDVWSPAIAQCPAGSSLIGGGYQLLSYNPICRDGGLGTLSQDSSGGIHYSNCWVQVSNAPDWSYPYSTTAWAIGVGAEAGSSCFVGYALCASN